MAQFTVYVNLVGEIVLRCNHEDPPMGTPLCSKCREEASLKLKAFFNAGGAGK